MTRGINRSGIVAALFGAGLMAFAASPALATFHLWHISEIYSNASGSVQFIEFQQPSFTIDDERFLTEASLSDSFNGNHYVFPTDLPSMPGPSSHFLIATPGYAALPGVPAPDYILPTNNWFNPNVDTLTYAGGVDIEHFTTGQLPKDGINALLKENGAEDFTVGPAFATNFLGASGSVTAAPEPASLSVMLLGITALAKRRRKA